MSAAIVLPFALWFVGERHDLGRLYASEVRIEDGDGWIVEAGAGLAYVARIAAYYLAPLGAVLAVCAPVVYRRVPRDVTAPRLAAGFSAGSSFGCWASSVPPPSPGAWASSSSAGSSRRSSWRRSTPSGASSATANPVTAASGR